MHGRPISVGIYAKVHHRREKKKEKTHTMMKGIKVRED